MIGGSTAAGAQRPSHAAAVPQNNQQLPGVMGSLELLQLYDALGFSIHLDNFTTPAIQPASFEAAIEKELGPGTLVNLYLVRKDDAGQRSTQERRA